MSKFNTVIGITIYDFPMLVLSLVNCPIRTGGNCSTYQQFHQVCLTVHLSPTTLSLPVVCCRMCMIYLDIDWVFHFSICKVY